MPLIGKVTEPIEAFKRSLAIVVIFDILLKECHFLYLLPENSFTIAEIIRMVGYIIVPKDPGLDPKCKSF